MDRAIDFGELVGAQVRALIEGELEGAEQTWRFIEEVGFTRNKDGQLELQLLTFDMVRLDVDGERRTHTITIPVLTLLPLPMLSIQEANIGFHLTVEGVTTTKVSGADQRERKANELKYVPR